jgi:hypothetical protein
LSNSGAAGQPLDADARRAWLPRAAAAVGAVDAIAGEQIMPGSREHEALVVVRDTVQRFMLLAFLCEVTGPWRPGRG